jgi:hypothetical protein
VAIVIKDVGTLQTKYTNRAVNATSDYKAGVMAPRASQSANAIAAASNWQSAVSSSTALARFKSGLASAGDAGWQAGASGKGAAHYADGVRGGSSKWAAHTAPFLQALASLSLPLKGIRGSDANIARVSAVASALHALKLSRAGAK